MITTTHARPSLHPSLRGVSATKAAHSNSSQRILGTSGAVRGVQALRALAPSASREKGQPAATVPFN